VIRNLDAPAHRPIVLKLGGELLDDASRLATVVSAIASIQAERRARVVIVHGGGKEIDAALRTAGIEKRQVDGLRITDEATLDVVVSMLAGTINTRLVAALVAAGVPAVGLTGADARCAVVDPAPPHAAVDGSLVDLGCVGVPGSRSSARLFTILLDAGFVPVVACIGADAQGRLFNVNADVLAADVAGRTHAQRLVVAGTTAGVLDAEGATMPVLDTDAITASINRRTATAGMIAKLRACERALADGVDEVVIVDGRDRSALELAAAGGLPPNATRLMRSQLAPQAEQAQEAPAAMPAAASALARSGRDGISERGWGPARN
jgi:acetylglutamate kinase